MEGRHGFPYGFRCGRLREENSLEAISKNGFLFKIKADASFKPEAPAKPVPVVVNTAVFRGFGTNAQRRYWVKRLS